MVEWVKKFGPAKVISEVVVVFFLGGGGGVFFLGMGVQKFGFEYSDK